MVRLHSDLGHEHGGQRIRQRVESRPSCPGSNFHYVRDPWGSYSEYSCDTDFIPLDIEWDAGNHAPAHSFYLWGPGVPPVFAPNFESSNRECHFDLAAAAAGEGYEVCLLPRVRRGGCGHPECGRGAVR